MVHVGQRPELHRPGGFLRFSNLSSFALFGQVSHPCQLRLFLVACSGPFGGRSHRILRLRPLASTSSFLRYSSCKRNKRPTRSGSCARQLSDAKLGKVPHMLRAKPVPCRPRCLSGGKFWWATAERSSLPPPLSTLTRTEVADLRKQRAPEKLPFRTPAENLGSQLGLPRDYVREGSATRVDGAATHAKSMQRFIRFVRPVQFHWRAGRCAHAK